MDTLFHAPRAFRLAGNKGQPGKISKEFAGRAGKEKIRIGEQTRTAQEWEQELDKEVFRAAAPVADWTMYRGNASRTAQGNGGAPFLEKRYARPTVGAHFLPDAGQYEEAPTI